MSRFSPFLTVLSLCGLMLSALALDGAAPQAPTNKDNGPLAWPEITAENRPWTRWWWLGSAVDKANLTLQLEQFKEAGIGGVEICPIYGARGAEDRYIDFLSPKWMEMLAHTVAEAHRLGLGVDMTTGTGWPFGGPNVTAQDAIAKVVLKSYDFAGKAILKEALPKGQLQCLVAVSEDGQRIDLTGNVKNGRIEWTAPPGQWRLYAVLMAPSGMVVKRPAPGGEGLVIDPFSLKSLDKYLGRFDQAFAGYKGAMPRSQFHDSFEYSNATWTPDFLKEFEKRRSYDLRTQLPALFGVGDAQTTMRVRYDYRLTISELHEAFIARWTEWCHRHGSLSRDQAHGAPANLIDAYALADIPETESYKTVDNRLLPMMKFASSAAHLSGRKLTSCESFTWLREHFQTSLADLKPATDFYFLAGVNHIFFHGIPYSPKDAVWPGWQFYASVNFGPYGGLWHDLPEFNAYVARCQSILQAGQPANDVLLYFPVHDLWQKGGAGGKAAPKGGGPGIGAMQFTTPGTWMFNTPFHMTALALWEGGIGFDEVSDKFLAGAEMKDGAIRIGGNSYKTVLVPSCEYMPETTLRKLLDLADGGATVVFVGAPPRDVPGFGALGKRRAAYQTALAPLSKAGVGEAPKGDGKGGQRKSAKWGKGSVVVGSMEAILAALPAESFGGTGIRSVRRTHPEGYHYFLVNRGDRPLDGWVTLTTPVQSAVVLDPRFQSRAGVAKVRPGIKDAQVYLQLKPGESCVLRTFTSKDVQGRAWPYLQPAGKPLSVAGAWKVRFTEGGPALPAPLETQKLASWTALGDAETKRFAGTAVYTLEFDGPAAQNKHWLLSLGRVAGSVRVDLNGHSLGTLWCPPFEVPAGEYLRPGKNVLKLEVTNVAANRIADMDRQGVKWKIFRDANVASVNGGALDASRWPIRDAGLLGPVELLPMK